MLHASALRTVAQTLPRTFGARVLQLDDGTGSFNTISLMTDGPLVQSYWLKFPNYPPPTEQCYFVVDGFGNIDWSSSVILPNLSPGSIWYGNHVGNATELPPGPTGSMLVIDGSLMPSWTTVIPSPLTISASQITTGTIQPGVTIDVGLGGIVRPTGGKVVANELQGAGFGAFSGAIAIPTGADHVDVSYTGIKALSSVTVSVFDPQASTFGFVSAQISQITVGIGFRVILAANYPASGTGELHYVVVNP